jgi:hypothetical protein
MFFHKLFHIPLTIVPLITVFICRIDELIPTMMPVIMTKI